MHVHLVAVSLTVGLMAGTHPSRPSPPLAAPPDTCPAATLDLMNRLLVADTLGVGTSQQSRDSVRRNGQWKLVGPFAANGVSPAAALSRFDASLDPASRSVLARLAVRRR